jgi:hypothetical protein
MKRWCRHFHLTSSHVRHIIIRLTESMTFKNRLQGLGSPYWYTPHTKFRENQLICPELVREQTQRQHGDIAHLIVPVAFL